MCTLEPQRECKHVTKLVPRLKPTENCVDVPKEVCVRSRVNPRRVQKPVIKKWCYTPSEGTGLIPGTRDGNGNGNQGKVTPPTRPPPVATGCARGYPVDHCPRRSGDGRCHQECNTRACGFDGGDCRPTPPPVIPTPPPRQGCLRGRPYDYCPSRAGDGVCHRECNTRACNFDGGDCRRPPPPPPTRTGCLRGRPFDYCPSRAGDGVCHRECNTRACNFDGGDCRPTPPPTRPPTPPPSGCAPGYSFGHCVARAGNGRCDIECNTRACEYDGGDCAKPPPPTSEYLPPQQGYGRRNG